VKQILVVNGGGWMKLIYVWIEEFRNIFRQGFCLDRKYNIYLKEDTCEQTGDKFYRVSISENDDCFNLMEYKNIENLTAIVGKNGAGKTSWLLALSELHTSYKNSKFLYIYVDEDEDKFYYECNNVNVVDFNNDVHKSEQSQDRPEASIFKVDFARKTFEVLEKNIKRSDKINYTLVRHATDHMTYPNANAINSYIGRYGTTFKERGIFYKFDYLYTKKARAKDINHNCLNLTLTLDKQLKYSSSNSLNLMLIPEHFPEERCLFDCMDGCHPLFKKAFMLRFIEIIVLNMRGIEDDCFRKYIDQLKKIASDYNYDVSQIYNQFNKILKIVVRLHDDMLEKHLVNSNDTQLCYIKFLKAFKRFIEAVPNYCFENSRNISVPFNIISSKNIEKKLIEVLDYFNIHDVESEFNSYILEIDITGLSDGFETISNIYAAIYKCIKLNDICDGGKIILALDEPDCYMHPEWSRRFISDLYKFLSSEFSKYNFEIIITTHSPYILSDIDSRHVIFLEDGEVKEPITETFGQNIHTIIKKSFFLDFTLGEFARKQIENVNNYLEEKCKNPDYNYICEEKSKNPNYVCEEKSKDPNYVCKEMSMDKAREIISVIGEPVIKNSLEEKFKSIEYTAFSAKEKEIIDYYNKLSSKERKTLIKHIITEEQ
jgi:ABC-type multidrug transport system ATPase subunit